MAIEKTYNKKGFLLPDSPRSMASFHAKVDPDGIYKLTIHDCRGSIQLWGDLKDNEQRAEAVQKLNNLICGAWELHCFIVANFPVTENASKN